MSILQKKYGLLACCLLAAQLAFAQPWSERMAATFLHLHPDSIVIGSNKTTRWDYEQGLMLRALEQVWRRTADGRYFAYIQKDLDLFVQPDGSIRTYRLDDFNIDNVASGHALLLAGQVTGQEKYHKAAQLLRRQLAEHPRTKAGGFWHKKRYPNQMWLDGLYMAEPFYAEYSLLFNELQNLNDIARQFTLIEQHTLDPKTGLLFHGYDESRAQRWANPTTGCSPNFWGRSMGWHVMALVDVLDFFPKNHPQRAALEGYLARLMTALVKYQDPATGCWWQITDRGGDPGNYLEASATCMYVYALLKGVRTGCLDASLLPAARKGYAGMLQNFVSTDTDGRVHLEKTVSVGGLGGNPYRDGSYEYYLSEPLRKDDLKGVGPFIMASVEMERLEGDLPVGRGKTVLLDRWFNNEYRNGARFHYTWEDQTNSGFAWWGDIFRDFGAKTASLDTAPTKANLKNTDVYIIVDPDTRKETAAPNWVEKQHVAAVKNWVKRGGTLVLLANDTANCEVPHFNQLAAAFGIRFTEKSRNMVKNNQFEQGKVVVPAGHPIFKTAKNLYIKELSTLAVQSPATASLTDGSDIIMATASYGKGRVFALGDPWLYNEYVDGRKLPPTFDNFQAARDLAQWLLSAPTPNP